MQCFLPFPLLRSTCRASQRRTCGGAQRRTGGMSQSSWGRPWRPAPPLSRASRPLLQPRSAASPRAFRGCTRTLLPPPMPGRGGLALTSPAPPWPPASSLRRPRRSVHLREEGTRRSRSTLATRQWATQWWLWGSRGWAHTRLAPPRPPWRTRSSTSACCRRQRRPRCPRRTTPSASRQQQPR